MRKIFLNIALASIVFLGSCKKDNFDAPESDFSGRLLYQGQQIHVRHAGFGAELWQKGFGKFGVINVNFNQEGMFSSKLFDGNYKFTVSNSQVPFLWPKNAAGRPDSLDVNLSGDKVMDLEVRPYFMLRSPVITYSAGAVNATCSVEKIITDANGRDLERVTLYVNNTQFVDDQSTNNKAKQDLSGAAISNPANLTMSVAMPTFSPVQNYAFARIGIKISGIENMVFSPVVKLTF
ncbi:DUF3823 domain-containing protein [Pedobacter metabolipauper]|uniref:Uncharacterized protein DUF3823 n=1 Tax=Pedobacter metabolipauper TaxID=425513 RepID=A0A4R6SZT3_9SPHI|nr:DUF3823 domain-containing protein [Pedobacter metabolipauper]TDQ11585.1 uncharacterized protein DUF3823 [Pedobacter metabolipauper]